jgi:hypothetical protein
VKQICSEDEWEKRKKKLLKSLKKNSSKDEQVLDNTSQKQRPISMKK